MNQVHRWMLVHTRLPEWSTGAPLGEGASEEEWTEQILWEFGVDHKNRLSFMNLATVLYNLPKEVGSEEVTRYVNLQDSILVLELLPDGVLSALEVSTLRATPRAVAAWVLETHALFALRYGGGIDRRLQGAQGMDRVYQLRQEIRKNPKNPAQIGECLLQLDALYPTLPITSLKRDLKVHYEAALSELGPHSFRAVVQMMPRQHRVDARLPSDVVDSLQECITGIVQHDGDTLWGMVMYDRGQCIAKEGPIPDDTAQSIHAYLTSLRDKALAATVRSPSPRRQPKWRAFGLALATDEPAARTKHSRDGFMRPPPLSLLSAIDEDCSIGRDDSPDEDIWLPCFSWKVDDGYVDAHVALFNVQNISAILLVRGTDAIDSKWAERVEDVLVSSSGKILDMLHHSDGQEEFVKLSDEHRLSQSLSTALVIDRERGHVVAHQFPLQDATPTANLSHSDDRTSFAASLSPPTLLAFEEGFGSDRREYSVWRANQQDYLARLRSRHREVIVKTTHVKAIDAQANQWEAFDPL